MKRKNKLLVMLVVILIMQILLPMFTIIMEIDFTIKAIAADSENSWDVSEKQDGSIIATFDEKTATLKFVGKGKIKSGYGNDHKWYSKRNDIAKVIISDGIENIPREAFDEYKNLREVKLGNGIKIIEYQAFRGCDFLSYIELPAGLKTIRNEVFVDCKSLNSIELPEGLETIMPSAFENCYKLKNINIPNSVKKIGISDEDMTYFEEYQFNVFRGCNNLENISVGENNTNYSSVDGVLFNKDKTKLISYPAGKKTTEYTIPSTVKKIGSFSIHNAANIIKINIPEGVTEIRSGGINSCENLSYINIPKSMEFIYEVRDCRKLKNIKVDENNANYSSDEGILFNKDKTKILCYPSGKEDKKYIIPNSVTTIGSSAFKGSTNLENIIIPNSVVDIENHAFYGCTALTEITIPNSVNKMGKKVLIGNEYSIFGNIFEECVNLKSITLPSEIETFYTVEAFKNCKSLEKIIIPNGIISIMSYTFFGCTNLSSVKLPESVIQINHHAFYECSSLMRLEIPKNVSTINGNSFYGAGLEILDIPKGTTTIEDAFSECRNLRQINIPNTVTTIDDSCFSGAVLTIKVETNFNESYEIELPEVLKRTRDSKDILYSESGLYTTNCTLSEDKIIASKDMLEQGKVELRVKKGSLKNLQVVFEATTYSDTQAPIIEDISCSKNAVYRTGDVIWMTIRTSEYMKGNPPKLKFRFGDSEEKIVTVPDNVRSSSTQITFLYTVQEGDNGLLKDISFEGEELTDWAGNKLVIDNIPKLDEKVVANTMPIETGMIKDEYHITNKDELKNIQELAVSGTYDFYNSTIYLENDIDLECSEDNQWIPIGSIYKGFRGIFEGNGHRISGVYINSEDNYQGFIGYNSGIIRNLTLDNSYICSTGTYTYVGGITGCNYGKTTIKNCYNKADVYGKYNVGGITGGNNNRLETIKIMNCYNIGKIEGSSSIRRNNRSNW